MRCLTLLTLVGCLVATVLWDRQLATVAGATRWGSERLLAAGLDWSASLVARLADDALTLAMFAVLVILLLYGIIQLLAARGDAVAVLRGGGREGTLSWLSGRPAGTRAVLAKPAAGDGELATAVAWHFGYGRDALQGPLRFAQWAFPVVGFIGTVIGVSGAVRTLPEAVRAGQIDEGALRVVLGQLHVAFDTTFAGLAASVIVSIVLYALDDLWDRSETVLRLAGASASATGAASATEAVSATARTSPADDTERST